jgi:ribonuclease HI
MSRCVWALVDEDLTEHIVATEIDNPKTWLFFMQETLSAKEFQKLLIICWAIWRARRKALHEDIFQSPLSIFNFITKYLDDLKLAGLIEDNETTRPTRNKKPASKWIPPPEAFLKFNVDGAVARSGDKGTVGVVCRDNVGNYVAASAMVIDGLTDVTSLEALACSEATSLATDMGVRKCVIASDCLEVIMNLQKQSLCAYSSVLKEIKVRSTLFQEVVFKHEGRESNCEAHALAKSVCKLAPGRYVWLLGRPEILHVPQNIMS